MGRYEWICNTIPRSSQLLGFLHSAGVRVSVPLSPVPPVWTPSITSPLLQPYHVGCSVRPSVDTSWVGGGTQAPCWMSSHPLNLSESPRCPGTLKSGCLSISPALKGSPLPSTSTVPQKLHMLALPSPLLCAADIICHPFEGQSLTVKVAWWR